MKFPLQRDTFRPVFPDLPVLRSMKISRLLGGSLPSAKSKAGDGKILPLENRENNTWIITFKRYIGL